MTKYIETRLEDEDTASAVLESLAGGNPFVFVVAELDGDGIGLFATTGGGISDSGMVRKMLEMTLKALP